MQKKVLVAKLKNGDVCGLVSLECEDVLKGKLNLFEKMEGTLFLKIGENLLVFEDANSQFEFNSVFQNLNNPICVLFCCENKILVIAKSENFCESFESVVEKFKQNLAGVSQKTQSFNDSEKNNFTKNDVKKLEKSVKNDENFEKNQKNVQKTDENLTESIENVTDFFEQISSQFDELFKKGKHFLKLEQQIPNTKWVKVFCKSEFSNHYILGKIFDEKNLTHICFGMPSKSEDILPDESLKDFFQWLPFEIDGVKGSGYFITYQDAKTGENVVV